MESPHTDPLREWQRDARVEERERSNEVRRGTRRESRATTEGASMGIEFGTERVCVDCGRLIPETAMTLAERGVPGERGWICTSRQECDAWATEAAAHTGDVEREVRLPLGGRLVTYRTGGPLTGRRPGWSGTAEGRGGWLVFAGVHPTEQNAFDALTSKIAARR